MKSTSTIPSRLSLGLRPALLVLLMVPSAVVAQTVGTCATGSAERFLEGNNVRASLYNTGGLFWAGRGETYEVPRGSGVNAIFATGIWIGGLDQGGQLRFAGTAYGPFEYWPGPLGPSGNPPSDCSVYDRIFSVSRADLEAYDQSGALTDDLRDWPWALGAPVVDGDGNPDNYSLQGGDRPGLVGAQTAWWVMNDVGNGKQGSKTQPMGLEVQVTAYALDGSTVLDVTTIYSYKLVYRGTTPLTDTYFGFWSDPDLGEAVDDLVGSDPALDLGFVYNGQPMDPKYGIPPALGYKLLQGPIVPAPGETAHVGGRPIPEFRNLGMTSFVFYETDNSAYGHPSFSNGDAYRYLRSVWRDGEPMTMGGKGYGGTEATTFSFPGDPVTEEYWSERNLYGSGERARAYDRRFTLSSGPFTMNPGDVQEIIFGIVWARGGDFLDSVVELKAAVCEVQQAVNDHVPCYYARPEATPPGPVENLLSPAPGVGGQPTNVSFTWEEDPDPLTTTYDVQVATEAGFADPLQVASDGATIEIQLEADREYWWRVRRNVPGAHGPWSNASTFMTGNVNMTLSGSSIFTSFLVVANAAGPIDPPTGGAADFAQFPVPRRPGPEQQAGPGIWMLHTGDSGSHGGFDAFIARVTNGDAASRQIMPWDFELRFTAEGSLAYDAYCANAVFNVPFEIWRIGAATPDDTSDDIRMVPWILDNDYNGAFNLNTTASIEAGAGSNGGYCGTGAADHTASGATNDPQTDWIYWTMPYDMTPGQSGYLAWKAHVEGGGDPRELVWENSMRRMVLFLWNGGDVNTAISPADYVAEMPEIGTVFRINTIKPATPILASPAPATMMFTGSHRLFWTASPLDVVRLEVRSDTGYVLDLENAESGVEISLPTTGNFTWRVISTSAGSSDSWTFTVVSGVGAELESGIPTDYRLDQNYPNPFNPTTTIRFGLPEASRVWLDVFDVIGRRVWSPVTGTTYPAGFHHVRLDASDLPSGVYLYRLTANDRKLNGRMILLK